MELNYLVTQMINRKLVICDLDGTLANINHRLHYIRKENSKDKDWNSFFNSCDEDSPIEEIIELIEGLHSSGLYEIWITSGRSSVVKDKTVKWLEQNVRRGVISNLIMRKEGINTKDCDLKEGWLRSGIIPSNRVAFVIEDRQQVVDMWRRNGLKCLQVEKGNF